MTTQDTNTPIDSLFRVSIDGTQVINLGGENRALIDLNLLLDIPRSRNLSTTPSEAKKAALNDPGKESRDLNEMLYEGSQVFPAGIVSRTEFKENNQDHVSDPAPRDINWNKTFFEG